MAVVNFRSLCLPRVRLAAVYALAPSCDAPALGGQFQGWKTKASNVTKKAGSVYNFFRAARGPVAPLKLTQAKDLD